MASWAADPGAVVDSPIVNLAEQAEKLRILQGEILAENPRHTPLVMCPTCGHTLVVPRARPEVICARHHVVTNPHFLSEAPSLARPPADQTPALPRDDDDDGLGLAEALGRLRHRPNDPARSTSMVRFLVVVLLYVGLLGAAFAGLRWVSRF